MPLFIFTHRAQHLFEKLDAAQQQRIRKKLQGLRDHPDIHALLEPVEGLEPVTHRLRIGDYRLLVCWKDNSTLLVLKCGHRRDVYQ